VSRHSMSRAAASRLGLRRPAGDSGDKATEVQTATESEATSVSTEADAAGSVSVDAPPPDEEHVVDAPIEDFDFSAEAAEFAATEAAESDVDASSSARRRIDLRSFVVYAVLPIVALLLTAAAAFFKWQTATVRQDDAAAMASMQAAKDATVAILSYQPNTVEQQLETARSLLTGEFRDAYTQLTHDVVIPGAKQRQISVAASVPAIASVSADEKHAVAMLFVNQTTVIGKDAPSENTSSVRVTMDNVDGRWLISKFDPV
jgi:Mce-associated membrane protein